MINLGSEANLYEKDSRLEYANRPTTIHALIIQGTILGIKLHKRHRKLELKDPHAAQLVADTWVKDIELKKGERLTIWAD